MHAAELWDRRRQAVGTAGRQAMAVGLASQDAFARGEEAIMAEVKRQIRARCVHAVVADKSAVVRRCLRDALVSIGATAVGVATVLDGIVSLNGFQAPRCVLVVREPHGSASGWELARFASGEYPYVQVVLLVGDSVSALHSEQSSTGVAFLAKPWTPSRIALLIAAYNPAHALRTRRGEG